MFSTNQKGLLTELQCQLEFSKAGIVVFAPITPDSKADFVVDINEKLYRIQCKTASISQDKDFFKITCVASGYHNPHRYTSKEVDFYYTYCEGKSYLLPYEEGKEKTFRLVPPQKNNQHKIRMAEDYEFYKILSQIGYEPQVIETTIISSTKKENNQNTCQHCGVIISPTASYCNKCNHLLFQRTVNRPSREELKKMIRTMTFVKIGEMYGVSDNAIRKWCDNYKLPRKKTEISSYTDEEWSKI